MKTKIRYWKKRLWEKDPIVVYALLTLLNDLAFALLGPMYALFLAHNGLNEVQMTSVNGIYMLTVFLMEVPTGTIADAYGRKTSAVMGWGLRAIGFLMYAQGNTFLWFAVSEALVAIGTAFISGALSAWVRETTDSDGYLRTISKTAMYSKMITLGISAVAGVLASKFGFSFIWYFGGVALLLATVLGGFLMKKDSPSERLSSEKKGLELTREVLKTSGRTIKQSPILKWMLLASFLTMASFQSLNMFWSLRFTRMFENPELAGPLFSIMMVGVMLGNALSRSKLFQKRHDAENLIAIVILISASIMLSALTKSPILALIFFVTHEIGRGGIKILQEVYLQKHLPESVRSALSSLSSMSTTLGATFGLLVAGQVASRSSIEAAWILSSIGILGLIPIYLAIKKRDVI